MRASAVHALVVLAAVTWGGVATAACVGDKLPPLHLDIEGNKASVRGATAGAQVLVVGYGRSWEAERFTAQFERYRSILTADPKGDLTVEFRQHFAPEAVFAAIDLQSGRCGSVSLSPKSGKDHRGPLDPKAVKRVNGKGKKVTSVLPRGYLVVVRPNVGVWDLTAGDGSAADDDRAIDGSVSFDVEALQPAGRSGAAPQSIDEGDVVLLFNPHQPSLSFVRMEN